MVRRCAASRLRTRRGEVERDAGELTGGEHVRKLFAAARDEQCVLNARFDHALGCVGDADRLHVDADEKDVRPACAAATR